MTDTQHVTATIKHLIATGTTEHALLTVVAKRFPDLTPAELSQALQVATTAAERQAVRSQPDPAKGRALLAHWRAIKPKKN